MACEIGRAPIALPLPLPLVTWGRKKKASTWGRAQANEFQPHAPGHGLPHLRGHPHGHTRRPPHPYRHIPPASPHHLSRRLSPHSPPPGTPRPNPPPSSGHTAAATTVSLPLKLGTRVWVGSRGNRAPPLGEAAAAVLSRRSNGAVDVLCSAGIPRRAGSGLPFRSGGRAPCAQATSGQACCQGERPLLCSTQA